DQREDDQDQQPGAEADQRKCAVGQDTGAAPGEVSGWSCSRGPGFLGGSRDRRQDQALTLSSCASAFCRSESGSCAKSTSAASAWASVSRYVTNAFTSSALAGSSYSALTSR